ncbi:MAG: hypothetical protein U0791_10840 [Gemmataceae bacterium]
MGSVEAFGPDGSRPEPAIRLLHWDRRLSGEGAFEPSRKLVLEAIANQVQTILHVWSTPEPKPQEIPAFTLQGRFDWAFCTPVIGEGCRGWGLYVAGRFAGDLDRHRARAASRQRTAR